MTWRADDVRAADDRQEDDVSGPLTGIRIVEFAGKGPAPLAGMLLGDLGADVVRVDRADEVDDRSEAPPLGRNRRSIALDLKKPAALELALDLIGRADGLLEGFRPGTMERLGLGPDVCLDRNPRLVYGRMTGWGQDGPLGDAAGHDVNYIALTGTLHAIGRQGEPPTIPLALVGDFGGGGMYLAFGMLAGLLESRSSGRGQVLDAAIIDGVALLQTIFSSRMGRSWRPERGTNLVDGGCPFYDVYECADGEHVSIGALEPKFYAALLVALGLDDLDPRSQYDRQTWQTVRKRLQETFLSRTRDEWSRALAGTDVCFAPVLTMQEARSHPHHAARGTFVEVNGLMQGGVGPRYSRTPGGIRRGLARPGQHTDEILAELGRDRHAAASLRVEGVVR
ncbi:MAG: CaiB/BaiF CoA transferase family protein [Microbacteriaceae bacterium]